MGDGSRPIPAAPAPAAQPGQVPNDDRPATIADVDLPPTSEDWDDYAVEPRTAPPAQVPPTQPVVQPVVQAGTQPPAATPQPQPGQAQPQPVAGTQPQPPAARPDQVFNEIAVELGKAMPAIEQALAERDYAIDEKEWERLQELEPRQVYSLLQARVHARAVNSMMRVMAEQLPVVVNGLVRAHVANSRAVERFWTAYPQLNRKEHGPVVRQMSQTMRALNPQMDEASLSRLVAFNAMLQLGISPQAVPPAPNSNGAGAPVQISQPGRQVRQVSAPYTPAGIGTAPASPAPPRRSQWDVMAETIEADDAGYFDAHY